MVLFLYLMLCYFEEEMLVVEKQDDISTINFVLMVISWFPFQKVLIFKEIHTLSVYRDYTGSQLDTILGVLLPVCIFLDLFVSWQFYLHPYFCCYCYLSYLIQFYELSNADYTHPYKCSTSKLYKNSYLSDFQIPDGLTELLHVIMTQLESQKHQHYKKTRIILCLFHQSRYNIFSSMKNYGCQADQHEDQQIFDLLGS